MAIYPLEFYRRAEEKWRRRSAAVTGSPSKKEGDDTLVRWPWLLAIGQGLQSEYAVLKKTTPPETSCGTAEEAYKVPPSLTVAVRDQQLRLDRRGGRALSSTHRESLSSPGPYCEPSRPSC